MATSVVLASAFGGAALTLVVTYYLSFATSLLLVSARFRPFETT